MAYYGLTIGPIVNTLSLARKTAEIWMASYMFSYMMKNIAKKLYEEKVEFIIPYIDSTSFEINDEGIGMYHDRIIFRSDDFSLEKLDEIIKGVKKEFATIISEVIKKDKEDIYEFFKDYVYVYTFKSEKEYQNPILETYPILDNLEHHHNIYRYKTYIQEFLFRDKILQTSLAKSTKKTSFPSIMQIAAKDFALSNKEDDYSKIEKRDDFKQVYKYIAIVHADGDNLGKVVKDDKDISKKLFEFAKKAKNTLKGKAETLFIGGDDLLFFAPVISKNGTIFDLIEKLRKDYRDALNDKRTTLSFGVSITYYKYPLYEALSLSRDALFNKAKKTNNKNNLAISVRKHSGQSFESVMEFDSEIYRNFKNLLENVLESKIEIPHSIHHKLDSMKELIKEIETNQIDDMFENYFNEEDHQGQFKEGLNEIKELLKLQKDDFENFFAELSMIKLLRGDR